MHLILKTVMGPCSVFADEWTSQEGMGIPFIDYFEETGQIDRVIFLS